MVEIALACLGGLYFFSFGLNVHPFNSYFSFTDCYFLTFSSLSFDFEIR